jgi:hypothetical protein
MHDDGTGNMVPVGNGDDPAVGQTNRVFARIRNVGQATASNVVADPLGMGITNGVKWAPIGKVDNQAFRSSRASRAGHSSRCPWTGSPL